MHNFPVFGPAGQEDEFLSPAPTQEVVLPRDPAREAALLDAKFEFEAERLNPALFDAQKSLQRARETTAKWKAQCDRLAALFARKQSELYSTDPFDTALKAQRGVELVPIQSALREAREEYNASLEEVEAATAIVDASIGVTK